MKPFESAPAPRRTIYIYLFIYLYSPFMKSSHSVVSKTNVNETWYGSDYRWGVCKNAFVQWKFPQLRAKTGKNGFSQFKLFLDEFEIPKFKLRCLMRWCIQYIFGGVPFGRMDEICTKYYSCQSLHGAPVHQNGHPAWGYLKINNKL